MLRYRRYRVFLLFAVVALFGLYQFGHQATSVDYLKNSLNFRHTAPEAEFGGRGGSGDGIGHAQEVLKNTGASSQDTQRGSAQNSGRVEEDGAKVAPPPVEERPPPVQQSPPWSKSPEDLRGSSTTAEQGNEVADSHKSSLQATHEDEDRIRVMPRPIADDAFAKVSQLHEQGEGRWDEDHLPSDAETVIWEKPVEHFPIAAANVVQLPLGTPKKLPKIQAKFSGETAVEKKERLAKLDAIKEAFLHSWNGYRERAWGKDELMPISGEYKNPFNGWGATLVDSLDLIWMMDLKDEFEEAVQQVGRINFKTSRRGDIPIFETTIRYLGGLIGAYDVSGGRYRVLLDKAVELAEIMIGSFDTPNRMPDTFYQWKPTFTSQPHRASTRVVLAELGSLALEFTRLAQLTKEPRYYDAVARITDALEEWQDQTRLPGMWPTYLDASGCKKPDTSQRQPLVLDNMDILNEAGARINPKSPASADSAAALSFSESTGPSVGLGESVAPGGVGTSSTKAKTEDGSIPLAKPEPLVFNVKEPGAVVKRQLHDPDAKAAAEKGPLDGLTSQHDSAPSQVNVPSKIHEIGTRPEEELPCEPTGLQSQSQYGSDEFTLGSMADSTYEYFPKMHLLLNGLAGQYKTMYEKAANAARSNLLFRVMIPDERREILVAGKVSIRSSPVDGEAPRATVKHEGSHLTCFVGGMFALGAKLFDRKEDMDLAAKLTDGCVWAYSMTTTGIMPETFNAVACQDPTSCPWNETAYWDDIDPNSDWRAKNYAANYKYYEGQMKVRESQIAELRNAKLDRVAAPEIAPLATPVPIPASKLRSHSDMEKRQLRVEEIGTAASGAKGSPVDYETKLAEAVENEGKAVKDAKMEHYDKAVADKDVAVTKTTDGGAGSWKPPTTTMDEDTFPPIYSPEPPLSHEAMAKKIIVDQRLPPGISSIHDRRYILRPEALESVFYMHRLTGEPYWRQSGWTMISAILKYTRTPLAHSAITDVTSEAPEQTDSMESFWLAETLKYAWLLFDDEERWSLDDWVLNTEAHLFKNEGRMVAGSS